MKGKLVKKIKGTNKRPRLTVFRSLSHIYAQVIDDDKGVTLVSACTLSKKSGKKRVSSNNIQTAKRIGEEIAKKCIEAGIKKVVFDRGKNVYHGKIAALADAARAGGLEF